MNYMFLLLAADCMHIQLQVSNMLHLTIFTYLPYLHTQIINFLYGVVFKYLFFVVQSLNNPVSRILSLFTR